MKKHLRIHIVMAVVLTVLVITAVAQKHNEVSEWEANRTLIQICVEPGDTLWEYAEMYAPECIDIRQYISEVKQMNGISTLQAGKKIKVWAVE